MNFKNLSEDNLFSKISYQFYLSELKFPNADLGYLVEFTRIVDHILLTRDLLNFTDTDLYDDEIEQMVLEVKYDRIRNYLFIITAAQLREALKLLGNFFKSNYYGVIKSDLAINSETLVNYFQSLLKEYDEERGILFNTLISTRNKIFHTDRKGATEWVENVKEIEKQRNLTINR